jgi:glycosyltransferase involved in cell wall biosynthesis
MAGFLPFALRSVLWQTSSDFEWIVIDDGSTDATAELLQSWDYPFLRVHRNKSNEGLTFCRNTALEIAKGQYLSILDADDFLANEKVERHAAILSEDINVGMVWGRATMLQPAGRLITIPEVGFKPGWDLASDYQAVHSATTWRVSSLRQAGGYDPSRVLVEGPDMFLKVGDFSDQRFDENIACIKRVFPDNEFRSELTAEKRKNFSQLLFQDTIRRRFKVSSGEKQVLEGLGQFSPTSSFPSVPPLESQLLETGTSIFPEKE